LPLPSPDLFGHGLYQPGRITADARSIARLATYVQYEVYVILESETYTRVGKGPTKEIP
jgi:diphthamide biosynthesis methyltransferase